MRIPPLVLTNKIGGEPVAWKCADCSEPFHLAPHNGTTEEKVALMQAAYAKHFKDRHSKEDTSQSAARIVREATKG